MNNNPHVYAYLKKGVYSIYGTFYRFPLTVIFCIMLASVLIYRIDMPYDRIKFSIPIVERMIGVIILSIMFTLNASLLIERFYKNLSVLHKIACYIIEVFLILLYYFYLFPDTHMVSVTRLILVIIAMTLAFLFIPYLFKRENFEIYVTKIITKVVTTSFFAFVLMVGAIAILFAIKSLLYNSLNDKFFAYTLILTWTIFAPIHFLSGLLKNDENFGIEHYSKILKVLLLYIVLPVLGIYTSVLYIYFAKIVITQEWPKGIVSYLVVSYAAIGIAAIFLITPLAEHSKWAKLFTSSYTKLIFPLLAMMFTSIGMRIADFGFTENRYFILAIGIWATIAVIFFNFNKGKNNIVLPVSLAVVALLTVFGPWDAFNVSKISQSHRFYNILLKYNMIQNEKIVNTDSDVSRKDKIEITEILYYFNREHNLKELKYLPDDFDFGKMKDVFGFAETSRYYNGSYYFNYMRTDDIPVAIKGYDVLFKYHAKGIDGVFEKEMKIGDRNIKIIIKNNRNVFVQLNNAEIYGYDLINYVKELYKKYGNGANAESIKAGDLVLTNGNERLDIMYLFNIISGRIDENGEINIDDIEADVMIKLK